MTKIFDFEKYFDCLIKIIPLNLAALAAMTIYRVIFVIYFQNSQSFRELYKYIFKSFFLGLRFDLSTLAYVNSLVILIFTVFLIIRNIKLFATIVSFIRIYYWIAFTAIILLNIIDFGFYIYFNEHINILFFDFFIDDTSALTKTIACDWRFPIALFIILLSSFIIYVLVSLTTKKLKNRHCYINTYFFNIFIKIFIIILIPFLTFLLARGTTSMFPLGKFHTQISPNHFINNLSLTSTHSLFDAIYAKSEQNNNIIITEKLNIDKNEIDTSIFNKLSIKNYMAKKIKPKDIAPTLYDLSLSQEKYISIGTSLLNDNNLHIAFNSEGFILSDDKAILYNIETDKALYFNFDTTTKMLSKTSETQKHKVMLKYYKKIIAISDIYLNQIGEQKCKRYL
jgi:hypothetical protein